MARIVWRTAAVDALEELDAYIRRDSAEDALRVVHGIMAAIDAAAANPEGGGIVLEYDDRNIRERLAYGFRIIYRHRPEHDVIEIVLIQRQTRRMPRRLD